MKKITVALIVVLTMVAVSFSATTASAKTITAPPGKDMPRVVSYTTASGTYCQVIFWQGGLSDLFRQRASLACWGKKTVKEKYRLRVKCYSVVTGLTRYRYTKYTKTGAERKMNCSATEVMWNSADQWKKK